MRTLLACLLALCLSAALAGCSDDNGGDGGTPTGAPPTDDDNETAQDTTFRLNGTSGVGAGVPMGPSLSSQGDSLDFTVEENATLIFAELAWDDPVVDLDLALRSPNAVDQGNIQTYDHTAQGGGPGQPDSPHSLTLTGADVVPGDWRGTTFASGASAGVPFRMAVSVFYGETEVPEGFSALNATAAP